MNFIQRLKGSARPSIASQILLICAFALPTWAGLIPPTRPTSFPLARPTAPTSAVAWGYNSYGETAVPLSLSNSIVAVAAGHYHNVALKADGTVAQWGTIPIQTGPPPTAATNIVAVAVGDSHSVALRNDARFSPGVILATAEPTFRRAPPTSSRLRRLAVTPSH